MKIALRLSVVPLLALAACKQEAAAPAPADTSSAAAATPDQQAGPVTISGGKLVLPAVKGRPAAAYFMISNSGTAPIKIAGLTIDGAAKAEMHETRGGSMEPLQSAEIAPGNMVMFEPGGKHAMAFGLSPALKPGDTATLTLKLADGTSASAPLTVAAPGDSGMAHGSMH